MSTKSTGTSKTKAKVEVAMDTDMQKQFEEMKKQMEEMQKLLAQKDKEVKEATKVAEESKSKSKQLDRFRRIPVRSVTEGGLTYISSANGLSTTWSDFGDEHWMEVEELIRMKSASPAFLTNPQVVIEDEEVIEYLGLQQVYDKIIPVDDMDNFFKKPLNEIEDLLKIAPKGTKNLVSSRARKLVETRELDSLSVIGLLEKALEIDLSMVRD